MGTRCPHASGSRAVVRQRCRRQRVRQGAVAALVLRFVFLVAIQASSPSAPSLSISFLSVFTSLVLIDWEKMRSLLKWASTALLASHAAGLTVDVDDPNAIKDATSTIAYGMMKYYTGNNTGDVPGNLPDPYYWWEAGAMFMNMIEYWYCELRLAAVRPYHITSSPADVLCHRHWRHNV